MMMLHYYTQKGFKLNYLLNLSISEKLFYFASMETALKERADFFS